jgi:hypothetical protein
MFVPQGLRVALGEGPRPQRGRAARAPRAREKSHTWRWSHSQAGLRMPRLLQAGAASPEPDAVLAPRVLGRVRELNCCCGSRGEVYV